MAMVLTSPYSRMSSELACSAWIMVLSIPKGALIKTVDWADRINSTEVFRISFCVIGEKKVFSANLPATASASIHELSISLFAFGLGWIGYQRLEIIFVMLGNPRVAYDQCGVGLEVECVLREVGRTGPDLAWGAVYQVDDDLVMADIDRRPFGPERFQAKMVDHRLVLPRRLLAGNCVMHYVDIDAALDGSLQGRGDVMVIELVDGHMQPIAGSCGGDKAEQGFFQATR